MIISVVALAAVICVYVMVNSMRKSMEEIMSDTNIIAAHLRESIEPRIEQVADQQMQMAFALQQAPPEPSCDDLAATIMCSMFSLSDPEYQEQQDQLFAAEVESVYSDEEEEQEYSEEDK
jgi:hypothetical protein